MVLFNIIRTPAGEPKSFTADLSGLAALDLPTTAQVAVEPYFGHSSMRFDFGTIGAIEQPFSTNLDEIDRGGEINFRVKVTDAGEDGYLGRLLAAGDRIAAAQPSDPGDGNLPLLPLKVEWLGELVWDISVSHGPRPYLLVNSRISGLAARLQHDAVLRGSILIEAFRRILNLMLDPDDSDEPPWFDDWKTFVNVGLKLSFPEDLQTEDDVERRDFVKEALAAFAEKFQFASLSLPMEQNKESAHD